MAILTTMAILAGLGALGGIINTGINHVERATDRKYNAEQAEIQREFEAEEAQKARDWETQMSNTAVQRQVEDMEKAGVNPAVALGNSGSIGASTPTSVSARGNSAHIGGGTGGTDIGGVLNGLANVARVYNNDSDHTNNLSLTQAVGMLANVAKIFK